LALAIGFLVGVERGWRARDVAEGGRTAGIRTYALSGLLGGVAGELSRALGAWALIAVALPFAAAFILFKLREQVEDQDYSVTDVVAGLLVFALGAYAAVGDWRAASAAAVATAALLAFKGVLHTWLQKLTWPELRGALVLLAMSFIALPLLPDRAIGPYGAFNPYELWLLTIAIAGVSFIAYASIRIFGTARGVILAALAGALVSSTAVTVNLARQAKAGQGPLLANAGGSLLAGAVMALRIGVLSAVLAPVLLARLAAPLGAFAAVSLAIGGLMAWRGRDGGMDVAQRMESPFELKTVLRFALLLGVIMAAAKVLAAIYGVGSLRPMAAVAGLADVDALTVTVARMVPTGLDLRLATQAVLIAGAADTLSKGVIALVVGGRRFGGLYAAGSLAAAGAALAALWRTAGLE